MLSVGLAMAIGVGVAVGGRQVAKADAETATYSAYTLDGRTADTSGGSTASYSSASSITQSGVEWGVVANTTMSPWRVGITKKLDKADPAKTEDRTISSKSAVTSTEIDRVQLEVGAATSITVNSLKLYVGTAEGLSDVSEVSVAFEKNSTMTFEKPEGDVWANRFFTVYLNLTNNTTSNRFVEFKTLSFEYDVEVLTPDTITVAGEDELTVGSTTTLVATATKEGVSEGVDQNVVWSSSNSKVAKVDADGVVTGVSNGIAQIRATANAIETVYCDFEVTVSGSKTTDTAFSLLPTNMPKNYGNNFIVVDDMYLHAYQSSNNNFSGFIQMQKNNGYIENVAALPYGLKTFEIKFDTSTETNQGQDKSLLTVSVSADGETFAPVSATELASDVFQYNVEADDQVYFKLSAGNSTIYLDYVLFGFGNANEAKMVTLASALNVTLDAECTGVSDNSPITAAKWAEIAAAYEDGDADGKAALAAVTGNSYYAVNRFLERYDYIVGTYGYSNFLARDVQSSSAVRFADDVSEANNSVIIIVISIAAASALAFTALLVFKKKKQK